MLRDTTNQYDYIIITVPEYVNACIPFKQHKEAIREFNTLIVDTLQIFAEFDSSATPQSKIRDFISYAGTFWEEPRPKFFLIVGRVSDVPNFPILYTYYTDSTYYDSDYYYSDNIYDNDSTTTDFNIGRIPCKNETELENYFNKVIYYESDNTLNDWKNNNLFICESELYFGFYEFAEELAEYYLPNYIRSFFIVSDSVNTYYGNKDSICTAINDGGCAVCWFYGHCNDSAFISQEYFSIDDISGLNNQDQYFLSIFISTQHSILDDNTNMSAEMMMKSESGSLGGIVHIGPTYYSVGNVMRRYYALRLFDPEIQSIGETFTLDNLVPPAGTYWYMKLITNLWTDPSLKLKYDTTVDVEKVSTEVPKNFTLYQNYPNPFNPSATIRYEIPERSFITLKVFDVLGNEIASLVNEEKLAGSYEVKFEADRLSSGIYFYKLQSGNFIKTKKMLLLK